MAGHSVIKITKTKTIMIMMMMMLIIMMIMIIIMVMTKITRWTIRELKKKRQKKYGITPWPGSGEFNHTWEVLTLLLS